MNLSIFLLDSLCFASVAVYRPGRIRPGDDHLTREARKLIDDVKDGRRLDAAAAYIARQVQSGMFRDFFGKDVTIVPAPGSAPRPPSGIWPSGLLAAALGSRSFLGTEHRLLERTKRVQKAAFARSLAQRPTAQTHFDTVNLSSSLTPIATDRITIVDDVVTTGATLLGCASRLNHAFPGAEVKGFALMRSLSRKVDGRDRQISRILDPVDNGRIALAKNGITTRSP